MYIERLDDDRMMIKLTERELGAFFISGDRVADYRLFEGLLRLAAVKSGLNINSKRITLQMLKGNGTVFIIAEVAPRPLLPQGGRWLALKLKKAENLLSVADRFCGSKVITRSALYLFRSEYVLTVSAQGSQLGAMLMEYGEVTTLRDADIRRLEEFADAVFPEFLAIYKSSV